MFAKYNYIVAYFVQGLEETVAATRLGRRQQLHSNTYVSKTSRANPNFDYSF
jgi:hypothetical protein